MGQTLSEPVTEKHTTVVVRGKRYWVGLSDMQGWRISMEDSHTVHLHMPPPDNLAPSAPSDHDAGISTAPSDIPVQPAGSTVSNDNLEQTGNALFGVFDGHGGSTVAKFTGSTLHTRLAGLESYKKGEYEVALKEAFLKTDEDLRADPNFFNDPSGCTAVVGLVTTDGRLIVANSGDSRSVLGYHGEAKAMSEDHKPTNKEETARITSAGGFVEFGRVNGNLALSRAIGDFEFKKNFSLSPEKQIVTADPEITTHKLDGEEEFLVLACDGIWDCLSSQQVIDFTRRAIANGDDLGKIAEDMMTKCLARDSDTAGIGCDNMTVVVVALLNGRTPEEWKAWVKERVDNNVGYTTPESVPDVFQASAASSMGGLAGSGFRVGGAGGLANIASILGASGITFKTPDDDSDEEEAPAKLEDVPDKLSPELSPALARAAQGGYMDDKALSGSTVPKDVSDNLDDNSADQALNRPAKSGSVRLVDDDGDSQMDSGDESDATTTGDAKPASTSTPSRSISGGQKGSPNAPSFTSIGSPEVPTHAELLRQGKAANAKAIDDASPQKQLRKTPEGDQASAAVRAEGLMDVSEGPLKL